jgi:hypothetical protein
LGEAGSRDLSGVGQLLEVTTSRRPGRASPASGFLVGGERVPRQSVCVALEPGDGLEDVFR